MRVTDTSLVTDGLHNSAFLALVQSVQLRHLLLAEIEVVDVGIADDPRGCVALWQRDEAFL
jgi:hypothetical protein